MSKIWCFYNIYIGWYFRNDLMTSIQTNERHNGAEDMKIEHAKVLLNVHILQKRSTVIRVKCAKSETDVINGVLIWFQCTFSHGWVQLHLSMVVWILLGYLKLERKFAVLEHVLLCAERLSISRTQTFQFMTTLILNVPGGFQKTKTF